MNAVSWLVAPRIVASKILSVCSISLMLSLMLQVAHYNVYLSDGLGINRSQINGALAFTATSVEA